MEINKIELIPIKSQSGLVAFAHLIIDNCFFIGSIGVHRKLDGSGYRLTYPTKKAGEAHIPLFHPTTPELSKKIEKEISNKAEQLFS